MDQVTKVRIKWGLGAVTISTGDRVISLDYIDLIYSFLKVDFKTRKVIGDLVLSIVRKIGHKI